MQHSKALPRLDERLAAVERLVQSGAIAADIGCDHGKLSAVLSTKCKKVIAIDCALAPLTVAREQMRKSKASNVECRLGDGILALKENEADTIIIAGLSAKSISDIIAAAPWVKKRACRLILVPATKPHELRGYLCKNGFELIADIPVKAAGRYYAVMCAEYCANYVELSPLDSILGKLCGEHKAGYLLKEAQKHAKSAQSAELARLVVREAEKCQK